MIYATSDWHLFHNRILEFCPNRPWDNLVDMKHDLVANYCTTVSEEDDCFFLGDLTIKRNPKFMIELANVIHSLPGNKHLVLGNHDYYQEDFYLNDCGFKSVNRRISTKTYSMVHNPEHMKPSDILSGKILLHGHLHAFHPSVLFTELPGLNMCATYDVGVDGNNYRPVSLDYIKEYVNSGHERMPHDHRN
jgi:calcineurin-like phosphoesterase family protein